MIKMLSQRIIFEEFSGERIFLSRPCLQHSMSTIPLFFPFLAGGGGGGGESIKITLRGAKFNTGPP